MPRKQESSSALIDSLRAEGERANGYVYFFQSRGDGPVKIGFSTSPRSRREQLQTAHGERISCLGYFAATKRAERLLHRHFAESQTFGEWYSPTVALLDMIATVAITDDANMARAASFDTVRPKAKDVPSVWELRCADCGEVVCAFIDLHDLLLTVREGAREYSSDMWSRIALHVRAWDQPGRGHKTRDAESLVGLAQSIEDEPPAHDLVAIVVPGKAGDLSDPHAMRIHLRSARHADSSGRVRQPDRVL